VRTIDIHYIVIPDYIEDKIEEKHGVSATEARQVLLGKSRIRFIEKGHQPGDNLYQTFFGRYLSVFFIYKRDAATAIIISARGMSKREKKAYGKK